MRYAFVDSGYGLIPTVFDLIRHPADGSCFFLTSDVFPLGDKSDREIAQIAQRLIKRMRKLKIDRIFVCCNTLSKAFEEYRDADTILSSNLKLSSAESVLIATEATCRNVSLGVKIGCSHLAYDIEKSNSAKIVSDIKELKIEKREGILACTHFPLVRRIFEDLFPDIKFVDGLKDLLNKVPRGDITNFYADKRASVIIKTFFPALVLNECADS